jgi:indolepyruvate ferredoxin oxidoreductase beta subunit
MMNCILAGVGGQGTVLASKIIAQSAMAKGLCARTAETIGMAQRGGCVVSHVRFGDTIDSPMIPLHMADLILGFEPAEAVRCLPYLKSDGTVVVNRQAIMPVTASLSGFDYTASSMLDYLKRNVKKVLVIDGDEICNACNSSKVLNISLLGAAAAGGVLGLGLKEIEQTILERIPEKFITVNLKALALGAQTAVR